jgi:hypothetical protein
MEVVKCAILDTLVAKNTQHAVRKCALAIMFFSCIHIALDWDEQNHHLLKTQYFELLPHFMVPRISALYVGRGPARCPVTW